MKKIKMLICLFLIPVHILLLSSCKNSLESEESVISEETVVAANETISEVDVKVEDAVNFEKTVPDFYAPLVIKLPKINLESNNAKALNEKLYNTFSKEYELLINNQEGAYLYSCNYQYTIKDGLVGILVVCYRGLPASEWDTSYHVFYYDANIDEEIAFEEYILKNGTTKDEIKEFMLNSNEYSEQYYVYLGDDEYEEYNKNINISGCLIGLDRLVICMENIYTLDGKGILQVDASGLWENKGS